MLAEADTIQRARELKSLAITAADWARRRGLGEEAVNIARSYALEAERRLGQLLKESQRATGGDRAGRTSKLGCTRLVQANLPPTLTEIGVSRKESAHAQFLAELPEPVFEAVKSGEKTVAEVRRERKYAQQVKRERRAEKAVKPDGWTITADQKVIKCQALITDPPYGIVDESWEPDDLESFTRDWASRWNECGANVLATFWSERFLLEGRRWFDESLTNYKFQQHLVWVYQNNKGPQSRKGLKHTWEPIFFYRRKGYDEQLTIGEKKWGGDLTDFDSHVAGVPQSHCKDVDRKHHPAQKPLSVMRWLVNVFSQPGDLVVDPFCGSGTTGIAAIQLGRRFHGIETDDEFAALAKRRIAMYGKPDG